MHKEEGGGEKDLQVEEGRWRKIGQRERETKDE